MHLPQEAFNLDLASRSSESTIVPRVADGNHDKVFEDAGLALRHHLCCHWSPALKLCGSLLEAGHCWVS